MHGKKDEESKNSRRGLAVGSIGFGMECLNLQLLGFFQPRLTLVLKCGKVPVSTVKASCWVKWWGHGSAELNHLCLLQEQPPSEVQNWGPKDTSNITGINGDELGFCPRTSYESLRCIGPGWRKKLLWLLLPY